MGCTFIGFMVPVSPVSTMFPAFGHVIRQAIEIDGFWSLWRGFYPMLWRDVPFSGESLVTYMALWCKKRASKQKAPFFEFRWCSLT